MNSKPTYVIAKVTNEYIMAGKMYQVVLYDQYLNRVMVENANHMDPNVYVDFSMDLFEEYQGTVITVDFRAKRKVA